MKTEFWIVGKNTDYENEAWEFQGIYDSEEKAVERCEDENWWVALVRLNEYVSTERCEWENSYYPFLL